MLAASGEDRKSVAAFGYCLDEKHAILEVDGFPREGDRLPGKCSPVMPCSRARAMASDEVVGLVAECPLQQLVLDFDRGLGVPVRVNFR